MPFRRRARTRRPPLQSVCLRFSIEYTTEAARFRSACKNHDSNDYSKVHISSFANHVFQHRMYAQRAWLILFDWFQNRLALFLLESCCKMSFLDDTEITGPQSAHASTTKPRRNRDETIRVLSAKRRNHHIKKIKGSICI